MKNQSGMTLMELMVVMAIVGILAAIAYPNYRATVLKSNRSEARISLMNVAGDLEKCFTRNMKYNDSANCSGASALITTGSWGNTLPNGYYAVTGSAGSVTFTLTATARGNQVADTDCNTLTIDQLNNKTALKSDSSSNPACWK